MNLTASTKRKSLKTLKTFLKTKSLDYDIHCHKSGPRDSI